MRCLRLYSSPNLIICYFYVLDKYITRKKVALNGYNYFELNYCNDSLYGRVVGINYMLLLIRLIHHNPC